jgi:hypothetical protein
MGGGKMVAKNPTSTARNMAAYPQAVVVADSLVGQKRGNVSAHAVSRKLMKTVPYANASTATARNEITKLLRRFGCESVGFMDDFDKHEVVLAFIHRGQKVLLRASAKGWAQMWLRENPWTDRRRATHHEYEQAALSQGLVAVNSILRDWIKGQITAVECGILSFEAVFLPHMITSDGRPLIERLSETKLLPEPPPPKVVSITGA